MTTTTTLKIPLGKKSKCFMCDVDLDKRPELAVDITKYPTTLYSAIFNNLANVLGMKDAQKRILQLSEEKSKQLIVYCGTCHGQVWQLYRLSNSEKREAEPTKEHIDFLKNTLMFKFAYGKRNNSKLKPLLMAHSNPSQYEVFGYWHLRETELDCIKQMYNSKELNAILAELDIEKLTQSSSVTGNQEDSMYFLISCETAEEEEQSPNDSNSPFELDDDNDIDMMIHSGRIAPIELVQIDMGSQFTSKESLLTDTETNGDNFGLDSGSELFRIPIVEMKPPRKQVLANRIGVSNKAVLKTIVKGNTIGTKEIEPTYRSSQISTSAPDENPSHHKMEENAFEDCLNQRNTTNEVSIDSE